ncbi:MAG: hypothetical protein JO013_05950 [Alphaproteobacteria bacterium]|nr:hypothetical protein [Alphaproteobacteria bacterium]
MRLLAFSQPADFHTFAVKWALERLGLDVDVLFLSDVPQLSALSFRAGADMDCRVSQGDRSFNLFDYDIVWFRRMVGPVPSPSIHESDLQVAVRDWRLISSSIQQALGRHGRFCVNPPASEAARNLKPLQLQVAIECGLIVPPTLISTSAEEIGAFIRTNAKQGAETIAKPLAAVMWRDAAASDFGFMTELVTEADVLAADVSSDPVIFQKCLAKSYEVRVTIMGHTMMAVKLESQSARDAEVDFRKVRDWRDLGHRRIDLPEVVAEKLLAFHSRLGIIFSTVDFIVTPDGAWVFLEANEMGNWLWIESCNPEIPLLDCFARFLCSRDPRFLYEAPPPAERIHAAGYAGSFGSHIRPYIDHQRDRHVEPRSSAVFSD